MVFQMTFAMITPGADRRRLRRAHEVLGAGGVHHPLGRRSSTSRSPIGSGTWRPGRHRQCRQGPRRRDRRRRQGGRAGQARRGHERAPAGSPRAGALDFAGGTVVHINAGIAGLVGCLIIGKRIGYPREPMPPALADHDDDRRLAAVGRLVRLQRRLEPRGQRHAPRSPSSTPWWRPRPRPCPGCSSNGPSRASRRCSAWRRARSPGLVAVTPASRLRRPDGLGRARPRGRPGLLRSSSRW